MVPRRLNFRTMIFVLAHLMLVGIVSAQDYTDTTQARLLCALEYEVLPDQWRLEPQELIEIERALEQDDAEGSVSNLIVQAECLIKGKDFSSASDRLMKVLNADPENLVARDLVGRIEIFTQNYGFAVATYGALIDEQPDILSFYFFRAHAEELSGDIDEAINTLKEGIEISQRSNDISNPRYAPDEVMLYLQLSNIHVRQGEKSTGIEYLKEGLLRNSMSDELLDRVIFLLDENQELDEIDALKEQYCSVNFSEICLEGK